MLGEGTAPRDGLGATVGAQTGPARGLAAGFLALVALTSVLIVLGALVRAHEAGLACPDWPLCFGQVVPEMDLRVAFEWSHRALAGSVGLLFAGLALACLRHPRLRAHVGPWLALGAVLLVLQILLGALTVWQLLASWTVTAHLVTGNAFNATLLLTALALRDCAAPSPRPPVGRGLRAAALAFGLLLGLQFVLGGLVSSTFAGMACPEWPACSGGAYFPAWRGSVGLHLAHRWNGHLLAGTGLVLAALTWRDPRLRRLGPALALLIALQLAVGVANVWTGLAVEVTGSHSALAALLALATAALLRDVLRRPRDG